MDSQTGNNDKENVNPAVNAEAVDAPKIYTVESEYGIETVSTFTFAQHSSLEDHQRAPAAAWPETSGLSALPRVLHTPSETVAKGSEPTAGRPKAFQET